MRDGMPASFPVSDFGKGFGPVTLANNAADVAESERLKAEEPQFYEWYESTMTSTALLGDYFASIGWDAAARSEAELEGYRWFNPSRQYAPEWMAYKNKTLDPPGGDLFYEDVKSEGEMRVGGRYGSWFPILIKRQYGNKWHGYSYTRIGAYFVPARFFEYEFDPDWVSDAKRLRTGVIRGSLYAMSVVSLGNAINGLAAGTMSAAQTAQALVGVAQKVKTMYTTFEANAGA